MVAQGNITDKLITKQSITKAHKSKIIAIGNWASNWNFAIIANFYSHDAIHLSCRLLISNWAHRSNWHWWISLHCRCRGDVVCKFMLWNELIPRVHPHFAFKCNNHASVAETLAALGEYFNKTNVHNIILIAITLSSLCRRWLWLCKQAWNIKGKLWH